MNRERYQVACLVATVVLASCGRNAAPPASATPAAKVSAAGARGGAHDDHADRRGTEAARHRNGSARTSNDSQDPERRRGDRARWRSADHGDRAGRGNAGG